MARLTITLTQPAVVGDRARADSLRSTYPYLPGGVVRGAFAGAWLARHGAVPLKGELRDQFMALFEGGVRFGPLFCGRPFRPLSVRVHKYGDEGPDCPPEIDLASGVDVTMACPVCRQPLDQGTGLPEAPETSRRTSVSLTHDGLARRGHLFTRDTLEESSAFSGHLVADDPALLDLLAGLGPVRVGGRRTTHGRAEITIEREVRPEPVPRLGADRIMLWLRGPAVLVDDEGRPCGAPDAAELHEVLGVETVVERSWVRWDRQGGWHGASGLPKPLDLAVAAGSTYVVKLLQPVRDEALARLAARGIGLRRHEGFGDLGGRFVPLPSATTLQAEGEALARRFAGVRTLEATRIWTRVVEALRTLAQGDEVARQAAMTDLQRIAQVISEQRDDLSLRRGAVALAELLGEPTSVVDTVLKGWKVS